VVPDSARVPRRALCSSFSGEHVQLARRDSHLCGQRHVGPVREDGHWRKAGWHSASSGTPGQLWSWRRLGGFRGEVCIRESEAAESSGGGADRRVGQDSGVCGGAAVESAAAQVCEEGSTIIAGLGRSESSRDTKSNGLGVSDSSPEAT
jgi:hypothetical protein